MFTIDQSDAVLIEAPDFARSCSLSNKNVPYLIADDKLMFKKKDDISMIIHFECTAAKMVQR